MKKVVLGILLALCISAVIYFVQAPDDAQAHAGTCYHGYSWHWGNYSHTWYHAVYFKYHWDGYYNGDTMHKHRYYVKWYWWNPDYGWQFQYSRWVTRYCDYWA